MDKHGNELAENGVRDYIITVLTLKVQGVNAILAAKGPIMNPWLGNISAYNTDPISFFLY